MATLLKIYLYLCFKILCAHARQSCHGGGISPGNLTCPEQTKHRILTLPQLPREILQQLPAPGLISTSLSLLHRCP